MSKSSAGQTRLFLPYGQTSGEAAFQNWSETVATVYDLDVSRQGVNDFRFGFSAWHFGSLVLGVSQSDRIKFWRSPQTIARSGIDHYLVQVYEQGSFRSHVEGQDMVVDTGDVWIVDLSRSVKNDDVSFRSTNLAIPRNVLAPLLRDPDAVHGMKLSPSSAIGRLLSRYLIDLSRQAKTMTPEEATFRCAIDRSLDCRMCRTFHRSQAAGAARRGHRRARQHKSPYRNGAAQPRARAGISLQEVRSLAGDSLQAVQTLRRSPRLYSSAAAGALFS